MFAMSLLVCLLLSQFSSLVSSTSDLDYRDKVWCYTDPKYLDECIILFTAAPTGDNPVSIYVWSPSCTLNLLYQPGLLDDTWYHIDTSKTPLQDDLDVQMTTGGFYFSNFFYNKVYINTSDVEWARDGALPPDTAEGQTVRWFTFACTFCADCGGDPDAGVATQLQGIPQY